MRMNGTIRVGFGVICLGLGLATVPEAFGQSAGSTGGTSFSVQPMFVPVLTSNGQSTPVSPYMGFSNPFYNPYAGANGTGAMGTGMTNQQLGLMMLTAPGRMGGIGSGQISGSRPNPNSPKMTEGRAQALAANMKDPSPVRRATQPAGSAGKFFSRQSPTQVHAPRGRFDRQPRSYP